MDINAFIDHTLLKPDATSEQIEKLCLEAKENHFFGVCVNSSWVPLAKSLLSGSPVKLVAVIGFPLGAMSSEVKIFETKWCVQQGADEIDMVLAIGLLKEKKTALVQQEISEIVRAAGPIPVKVILETGLLTNDEKREACVLSRQAGAQFVKTCTGFSPGAATIEDILLMREVVGPDLGVKASGGIKNFAQAVALIEAGATRLGTSSGVQLVRGQSPTGGY